MEKKIIIFLIIFCFSFSSFAQKTNYFQSDNDTYQKYLQKDWKGLIELGKIAKRDKIEYYYLNVRMGLAYFEKGKYLIAIPYFEKALKENPDDQFVQDYLYYSYLYSGNEDLSLSIYSKMSQNLKQTKNINSGKMKDFDLNFGYHINRNYEQLSSLNYKDAGIVDVVVRLDKAMYNIGAGMNFQLSQNTFLYQMIGYRKADFLYIEQNTEDLRYDLSLNEFDYYGKFNFQLGRRWSASLNYNLLFGTSQDLVYMAGSGRRPGGYYSQLVFFGNVSSGFSITKQWKHVVLSPHINYLLFNGSNIFVGSSLILYPLGNTDLFVKSDVSYNPLSNENFPFVIKTEAGFRLWKFYFTGTYYYGKIQYFVEDDGKFVYNFNQSVLNQSAFTVEFFDKNKTYYIAAVPSVYMMTYTDENNSVAPEYSKIYEKFLVKFGIKWKLTNK